MKVKLFALSMVGLSVAGCMGGDPEAKVIEVAQAAVTKKVGNQNVQFASLSRGLSDKGEINVCGTADDRAFVAILRPGADSVIMESDAMPKDMIDGMTQNVCGPDAVQRFEEAKTADANGLIDRILS